MEEKDRQILQNIEKSFQSHSENVVNIIEQTVTSKVDSLTVTVKDWIEDETNERKKVKEALDEYIKTTQPMVDFFQDVTSAKKVLMWIVGGLGAIGAFALMIRELFNK